MTVEEEFTATIKEIEFLKGLFNKTLDTIPVFQIVGKEVLPFGLKPHTRSVSWIIEQIISQKMKFLSDDLDIKDVNYDFGANDLRDCEIITNEKIYGINIKLYQIPLSNVSKDISSLSSLYKFYEKSLSNKIFYACIGITFEDITERYRNC